MFRASSTNPRADPMTPNFLARSCKIALMSGASLFAMTAIAGQAAALTEAGQSIQNQATATYQDALGNRYTSQSNLASVEVTQVYFATIESDRTTTRASNQTTYFQHTLSNTGNGTDTYTVAVAQNIAGRADSGDFSTLEVYVDSNGNGVVDAGEPLATSISLDAGEEVSLVVAGLIPTAADGATFDSTLSVTSSNGIVTDLTTGKGIDGLDGTNEDSVTVTSDAVLNVYKSAVHDEATSRITYAVTVTNTGNATAEDVVIFDGIPAGTTLVGGSVTASGFGTAINANDEDVASGALDETVALLDFNSDGDITDTDESTLGIDLNTDGSVSGVVSGVYGFDSELAPGTSVEINFTVQYDPDVLGAGAAVRNVAYAGGDTDGDGDPNGPSVPSTQVTTLVPQTYAVTATDTGTGAAADVNDGGDDDGTANDSQEVDTAQAGELVFFEHIITNTGNGTDTLELLVDNVAGFPAGTSFTIWNESGTAQLLNTNGPGGVDTGPLAAGESLTVVVRAQLPASGATATASTYDLIATSADDPAVTPASDSTEGELLEILAPTVDLTNAAADGNSGVNTHAYALDGSPVTTLPANLGETVSFNLAIENDSQVPDSFQLSSGGSWTSATSTLGALPDGWNVVFRDTSGSVITTTPSIAAGGSFSYTAQVTVPTVEHRALADRTFAIDDAGNMVVDGNSDGDGDYGIFFLVTSVNSGASDIKLDAVDVSAQEEITLLQDNGGQVQPGGSVDYPHTVKNDGNTSESVTLAAANGTSNWSNNLLVDSDGDGAPDTPLGSLANGDTLYIVDANGDPKAVTLDASLAFPLLPGESMDFVVRTFAPTSAPNGQLDLTTVTASFNNGGTSVTNVDRTEVITSQLRLTKTASVDAGCADVATADLGPDVAFTATASAAAPGDCAVWQVVARNAGVDTVSEVDINDFVPAFTAYRAGTLRVCFGDAGTTATAACTFSSLTDAVGDDEGAASAGDVGFTLGGGATPVLTATQIGSGESITLRFSTEIE